MSALMPEVEGECAGDTQPDCPRILPTWCAIPTCPKCGRYDNSHSFACIDLLKSMTFYLPAFLVGEDCGGGR